MQINTSFSKSKERIEIKEIFAQTDLYKFEKALKSSFFSFREAYPKRRINSLYFDNYLYGFLTDSLEGNSSRKKKNSLVRPIERKMHGYTRD